MKLDKFGGKYIVTLGFSSVKVGEPMNLLGSLRRAIPKSEIQILRADRVAGSAHLLFAARNAILAFNQKKMMSRSLAMEVLLYTSCQRQISKAIELLGVTPQTREIAVTMISGSSRQAQDFSTTAEEKIKGNTNRLVLEINSQRKLKELKRTYELSSRQIEAAKLPSESETDVVERLVIEQSCLLALES